MNTFEEFRQQAITDIDALQTLVAKSKGGLQVYFVHNLGKSSILSNCLIPMDFYPSKNTFDKSNASEKFDIVWDGYRTYRFLGDSNLSPNGNVNQHLMFIDRKMAEKYYEWCKQDLASIARQDRIYEEMKKMKVDDILNGSY